MTARVLDITGQPCYACDNNGTAKVVHYVQDGGKHRFFFGCSASTENVKCPGSKPWQSVQVPEDLKNAMLKQKGLDPLKPKKAHAKKPSMRAQRRSESSDSDDNVVREEVRTEHRVSNITTRITLTKKSKNKKKKDQDLWNSKGDDEFVE